MTKNTLSFRTNSKLEKLIGRELITNDTIAFFELIKNSYDAGATRVQINFQDVNGYSKVSDKNKNLYYIKNNEVTTDTVITKNDSSIIITDNGHGMSFDEVNRYWMEIGVVHKELEKTIEVDVSKQTTVNKMYQRILNGEKGIGRFGTDKLGAKLKLIAVDRTGTERTTVHIDYDKYDDYSKMLQEVQHECTVEVLKKPIQSGVTLEISDLRDDWTIREVEDLKRQLKKFISPFSQEQDNFSIFLSINNHNEKIINDAFEYSHTFIESKLDENGTLSYKITDNDIVEISETINTTQTSFGSTEVKIIYMDAAAKRSFARRTGLSTRQYGNIKVFRDNFRIFPYGEADNDWLGIDNKHAQAVFRSLGTRDIIGYVQISNIENEKLKDATNRLGLVEDTKEFEDFKQFIWKCINILQQYVFDRLKRQTEKQGNVIKTKADEGKLKVENFRKEVVDALTKSNIPKKEASNIISLIEKNNKEIQKNYDEVKKANEELNKKVKVFQRISGTEGILIDILHTIKNKTAILDAQLLMISRKSKRLGVQVNDLIVKETLESINKLINSALRKASSSRLVKKPLILTDIITESIEENINNCQKNNITVKWEYNDRYQRVKYNKESIKIVLDNLFNNSIKSLLKSDSIEKQIHLHTRVENNTVQILFNDNGQGIEDEDAPFIFNVGFTTTKGNGLGLANSLDIIQNHGGDMSYVKSGEFPNGATFLIKLPILGSE